MTEALERALTNLTEIQRRAVDWGSGPLLVLAGPGSGKTQVLTCRIARLLNASRDKKFRILALTFTNKAADEMKGRVAAFVPGLEDRANIGTFHGFCAQVLRQHGVHLGIKPDFAIYALESDKRAVLEDALGAAALRGESVAAEDVKYMGLIDRMKSRLIEPGGCKRVLTRFPDADRIALVYRLYEEELARVNALDFNSLIFEAHRLIVKYPAIAERYRRTHPYWLIDEFQDTNDAQFRLIEMFAGGEFRNVFAVADDDQIIYQWNGASFKNIQAYLSKFSAELIQLPTNYRCPPAIVDAANRLVAYNAQRSSEKKPLVAGKTKLKLPEDQHIQVRHFESEEDEAAEIAQEIAAADAASWGETTVLGRNRNLLERMRAALQERQVPCVIAQRRDDFLSPQFRWLVASLIQILRPLDRRNLGVLIESFNRVGSLEIAIDQVVAEAEATGRDYFSTWLAAVMGTSAGQSGAGALTAVAAVAQGIGKARTHIEEVVGSFERDAQAGGEVSDVAEDAAAWREISRDIVSHIGREAPLDQFLQELQLRSKEPSPKPGTVALMTIHGAKGREFDTVYVVGLAEDIMPSYHSRQKGDQSPEMEEERRNCFVAITRAKECLILSRAARYRGWRKAPSRFLVEMGLAE